LGSEFNEIEGLGVSEKRLVRGNMDLRERERESSAPIVITESAEGVVGGVCSTHVEKKDAYRPEERDRL
jgi:hypothetical protein